MLDGPPIPRPCVARFDFTPCSQIVMDGVESDDMFRVVRGIVRVEKGDARTPIGQGAVVNQLRAGQVFGEMSFMDKTMPCANCIADTDDVEVRRRVGRACLRACACVRLRACACARLRARVLARHPQARRRHGLRLSCACCAARESLEGHAGRPPGGGPRPGA